MMIVEKVWGREHWIVNNDGYCGKFLEINKNAISSLHFHREKRETFVCLNGSVQLQLNDDTIIMTPGDFTITIEPMTPHRFVGIEEHNLLLEISGHHDEKDVVRLEESRAG